MDGYWLPPDEPTFCIIDCICDGSIQSQRVGHRWPQGTPSRLSYIVFYVYLQKKKKKKERKTCTVHRITRKKNSQLFYQEGSSRGHSIYPPASAVCQEQFLKHAISNTKKPTYACIQIRLSRRKGGVSLRLPYQLLHLARGTEKLVIGVAAAKQPWSQVSVRCIRSNSMISNKIDSLLKADGVEIQKGQSCHLSWDHTAHSFLWDLHL